MITLLAILPIAWAFVTSRVGVIVICSAVSLGMGVRLEHEHVTTLAMRGALEAAEKRLADNEQITADADARERAATATAEAEHEKVVAYDERLAKLPVSQKCLLTRADLDARARRLRHKPVAAD
jgi:hypothetical protein